MFPTGTSDISISNDELSRRTAGGGSGRSAGRTRGVYATRFLAGIALLMHTFLYGVVATDAGWSAGERVHFTSAVLAWGVTAVPLAALLLRPIRPAVIDQLLFGSLMVLALLAIVGNPDNHGGQAGVYDPIYLIFFGLPIVVVFLARRNAAASFSVRWPLVTVSLLAAGPATVAAVNQELLQRNSWPPALDPHHNAHWMVAGIAVLAPVAAAAVAALGRRGWRLPMWTAGLTAITLGTVSLAYPADASSLGRVAGGALTIWGIALLLVGSSVVSTVRWERSGLARRRAVREDGVGEVTHEYPSHSMRF